MAELSISPGEIRDALKDFVASYEPAASTTDEVGTILDSADGIVHADGLPGVMANEVVSFEDGTLGLAQNLDERDVGIMVLGDFENIMVGQKVTRTGEILSVPVGDG
ncbi:F0F1 ATP synthase subunit alpha, partial [Streptomyces acidicola]